MQSHGLVLEYEEDELSVAQQNQYALALKAYEKAMTEVELLKKESSSVSESGNVWLVKSTYHVKIRNNPPNMAGQPKQMAQINTVNPAIAVNSLLKTLPPSTQVLKTVPVQPTPPTSSAPIPPKPSEPPTLEATSYPASQLLSQFNVNKAKPAQVVQVVQPVQPMPPTVLKSNPPVLNKLQKQPGSSAPMITMTNKPQEARPETVQPSVIASKKSATAPSEDPRTLSKTPPSLCVIVKPSKAIPEVMNQKKRETLDTFVKSRLILDPRRFAEWLMQVGLLRSQQFGFCRVHNPQLLLPMQLRMYAEESRFPHSGGYVWITKCCDRNFVSIFRESIFEDSTQVPTVVLKLIYHWACQTNISNVVQWVKVDHALLRSFYAMLRSACTVEVHTSTPKFGVSSKNGRVEVGVISLGTTSVDGKKRDVKVEVLGVYDQETQKMRLRACEPIVGETRSRARFLKILEPITNWVSPKAIILTDFTVEKTALEELGFHHVIQRTLNSTNLDDKQNNRTIMDYLRKTVPKVFQNTLSVLSTATIQQFLDELVWREANGLCAADAFHNIVRDLRSQTRAETGMPITKRLLMVALDPFSDWSITSPPVSSAVATPVNAPSTTETVQPQVSTNQPSGGVKRPAATTPVGPSNPKEPKIGPASSFYGTMHVARKDYPNTYCDPEDTETICQHNNCLKVVKTNLEMMHHLRMHFSKEVHGVAAADQCNYCLASFPSPTAKKEHEEANHLFLGLFKVGMGREDNAVVRDVVCLICHEKFGNHRQLELHLENTHAPCEMPYRCRVCNYLTSAHSQLVDHFYQQHASSAFLLCPLCLDTFSILGDNAAKHMDTGHLQYLAHLKAHLGVPSSARHRCQRCILTFLQFEQLRLHGRTDHVSMVANAAARPFTFTVIKPPMIRQVASPKQISSPPIPVPSTSSSKPKASAKEIKDLLLEVPNSTVARRFPGLSVSDESSVSVSSCFECKNSLRAKGHFSGYLCCSLCRFSTCCTAAMKTHQVQAHGPDDPIMIGPVFDLSMTATCPCGFSSRSGLLLGHHLAACGQKSVTVISEVSE